MTHSGGRGGAARVYCKPVSRHDVYRMGGAAEVRNNWNATCADAREV